MVERALKNYDRLKSKSGYTPEELFDILVALKSFGTEVDLVSVLKRKTRGAGKNILRAGGVSDENVSALISTKQTAFIKNEIGNLPGDLQAEFIQKLCVLERERVSTAVSEVLAELGDDNLLGVEFLGSMSSTDRWPNDVDINLRMVHPDKKSAELFRKTLEGKIYKKVDIKNIV